jgi:transcriptional regulator with XRE-family HTH domain
MDLVRILGQNVRDERRRAGKSQEELALDAGMKRSYLSDLERGTRNPSIKALERLATALNVEAAVLLTIRNPAVPNGAD